MLEYFELFELPVQLKVDKELVRQKFFLLSRKYHPDHFAAAEASEQDEVLENAATLNKAYKILTNDDDLIRYVLTEKGLLQTDEKYPLSSDFLMEMMDLNEELPEAMDDESARIQLVQQLLNWKNSIYEPVKEIVEDYKEGITSEEELLQVKDYYYKKKYLQRLAQQLGQKL